MIDPQSAAASKSAMTKWVNPPYVRFWLLVVLLAYTLGGFFGAPWLLERIATRKVAELDRTLGFGEIKVNPFLLTLQLRDTQMHDSDGALLFSYDDYFIDLQTSSLFRWAWTFKEIRLTGLNINAERFAPGDDRFGRLIDSFPVAEEPETEVSSKGLPRVVIHQLKMDDARLQFTDHLSQGDFTTEFGPINISVENLSTLPDQSGQQQVQITTKAGGKIAWQGSVQLLPFQSRGTVTVKGRVFADLDHYLAFFTASKLSTEGVDMGFSYQLAQSSDETFALDIDNLHARFNDWKLFLPEETDAFVDLPQLQISGASLRWPQQTLDVTGIELQQPRLKLALRPDGSLNLDRLLADFAGNEAVAQSNSGADSSASNNKEWQVQIHRFAIADAAVQVEDFRTEPVAETALQAIDVVVSEISNQPGASLPIQAAFALASGGAGSFDGQAVVLPDVTATGRVELDALQLPAAQPWVNDIARVTINSGSVSLNGEVSVSPEQPGSFQGSIAINELDLSDNRQHEKLIGWKQLGIARVEVDLAANTIKTSELELEQPYGRLQIAKDKSTNLDGLMIESAEAPEAEASDTVSPMAITAAGFRIADASLDFSDLTLPLPFTAAIRSLDGTISTLASNSEEPARVDLEGQVNEYGLARIGGSLNALDPTGFTDIQMTFRNLEMERMTPYTIEFAGWEIDAGRMDLDLDYKIKKGQLNGANSVVIREMTVGDKAESPSGASLPLKFAVALLKDSNGVIDVDLPVEGNLNDPSFRIGGIVWKAIGNLLVKAVTAPFRLLGSLVGVDSEDFGTLHFSAGQADISPPDREQLVKLVEAMRQRPELRLEVAGSYVVEPDQKALQTQQVDQRIQVGVDAMEASAAALSMEQRRQVMEQMLRSSEPGLDLMALQQEFSSIPAGEDAEDAAAVLDETAYLQALRQRLIEAEPVGETALLALADARADAVMTAIAGDGAEAPLPATRLDSIAVDAAKNGEIPMELKVEVAGGP